MASNDPRIWDHNLYLNVNICIMGLVVPESFSVYTARFVSIKGVFWVGSSLRPVLIFPLPADVVYSIFMVSFLIHHICWNPCPKLLQNRPCLTSLHMLYMLHMLYHYLFTFQSLNAQVTGRNFTDSQLSISIIKTSISYSISHSSSVSSQLSS